jgi:hypothetical protein
VFLAVSRIHPTAVVAADAVVADDVVIGPYAVVHPFVRLAPGVRVDAHAVLGGDPQDLTFAGGVTWLEVGRGTVIREAAIVHRATVPLRRAGVPAADCRALRQAYNRLRSGLGLDERAGLVGRLAEFLDLPSRRGICAFTRVPGPA